MNGYVQVSLLDMVNNIGEDGVKAILSDFSCPLNKDVEKFLKYRSLALARQKISPTYLVFTSYMDVPTLVGYYTVTVKAFCIERGGLSNTLKKRIRQFATYDNEVRQYFVAAPLIAQLGKNFTNGLDRLIKGDELLSMACERIAMAQSTIGGKLVYLECEDKQPLIGFYERNGFVNFDKRRLDRDETEDLNGEYLIQMLRFTRGG